MKSLLAFVLNCIIFSTLQIMRLARYAAESTLSRSMLSIPNCSFLRTVGYISLVSLMTVPAYAAHYEVDFDQSQITFSGTHTGNTFQGVFHQWDAVIIFDETDLAASKFEAKFAPEMAKTGDATYDGTLPQADWFATDTYPIANFVSDSISQNKDGSYNVSGTLTIRDITHPLSFDFTLETLPNGQKKASANFTIDRLAYHIGKGSDAKAEWVSRLIDIEMRVVAGVDNRNVNSLLPLREE